MHEKSTDARDVVSVFRLQLFKPSESFIRDQAAHLDKYAPVFTGRRLFGKPLESEVVVVPSKSSLGFLNNIDELRRVAFRHPGAYVEGLAPYSPRLVHAHFAIDAAYAVPLVRHLNVPLVTTLHGYDVTRTDRDMLLAMSPSLTNGILHRNSVKAETSIFVCVSKFIRECAIRRGFPEEKLRVHYIGIDTDSIIPRSGLGDDGLIVHAARLVEKKGTRLLLRAFAIVAQRSPHAKLVVIGDGPLRSSLEAEALALGLNDKVTFLGMLPNAEVLKWDAKATMKVVPSITSSNGDQEGFGIVNLEAAALGVPVVGFDSGGIGEAVEHKKTGFLAPEGDFEGLAFYMNTLLANSDLRMQMGKNARARVSSLYNIRRQAIELEQIYDQARGIV